MLKPLQHSINAAQCKGVIYDFDKEDSLMEVGPHNLVTPNRDVRVRFFAVDIPQGTLPAIDAEVLDYVKKLFFKSLK